MTGSTVLNPAVGISLQLVAACAKGDSLIFWRDVWPLVVPSIAGAIIGGYFMTKIYEPLLLYIKYKDLSEESLLESQTFTDE
jgi:glycerol uptake facilitator-like aquaporin